MFGNLPAPLYAAKPYFFFTLAAFGVYLDNPMGYFAATGFALSGLAIIKMRREG